MTLDDTTLIAYADGALDAAGVVAVERELAESPAVRESVARLRASRLPIREAFAAQQLPPLPEALRRRIEAGLAAQPAARRRHPGPWLAAAFVAGAFCAGLVQQLVANGVGERGAPALLAGTGTTAAKKPWISVAADYQQLYTRDTLAGVTPDPAVAGRIVAAVRTDDGIGLRVPDLAAAGLAFKSVDRLRYDGKPLVQIVYLPEHGTPVALCVVKDARADQAIARRELHGMTVLTWRHGALGYALIGKPDSGDLDAIARQIADPRTGAIFASRAATRPAELG